MFTLKTKNDALQFISSLQAHLKSNNSTAVVGLFGSFARGDFSSDSDIDIVYKDGKQGVLDDFFLIDKYCEENLSTSRDIVCLEDAEKHDLEMSEFGKEMGLSTIEGIAEGIKKDVIWSEKVV